jgi:hypothetical protein
MLQKQTKTILCVALFFIAHTATAQVTDFKLSDFKYRTPGFKALGFIADGNGGTQGNKNSTLNITPILSYLHNYSTANKQFSFSNQTRGDLEKTKANNDKSSFYGLRPILSLEEKVYKNKYFIGFGGESNFFVGGRSAKKQSSSIKSKTNVVRFKVSPHIGIGKGRIENVSNAQMALFILEDLHKAGKIKSKVSAENTMAFANLITQVYNRRVFDFRKRKLYEIEQIDSFLVANKILAVNDVRAINIISDNWFFAIQPARTESKTLNVSGGDYYQLSFDGSQELMDNYFVTGIFEQSSRLSGSQIYFRATPQLININLKEKDSVISKKEVTNLKAITFSLNYDNYKPIKLKWGWHKYANIAYRTGAVISDLLFEFDNRSQEQTKGSFIEGNIGVELGYYPNSRTTLEARWNVGAFKSDGELIIRGTKFNSNRIYTDINATTSYFINYNSRITARIGFQIIKDNATPVGVVSNFNVGYNLYIF